jgi:multiple sugar transport system ATP-binding protein
MNDGAIQQVDRPEALYHRPANLFVAGFIGTPPMNFFHGRIQCDDRGLVFDSGTLRLGLPPAWRDQAADYVGQPVVFGVRPEDIGPAPEMPDASRMTATIDIVEPLGADVHVHLARGEHRFVSRVKPHNHYSVGTEIELSVNLDQAHLLDPRSHMTIIGPACGPSQRG